MRSTGWLLAVPLSPVVLVGSALTLSIFGALFGLPILLFLGRPWWLGISVGVGRNPRGLSTLERAHLVVGYVFLVASIGAGAIVGANDLDTVAELAGTVVIGGLLLSAGVGTVRLLRPGPAWPQLPRAGVLDPA